jgi:HD-like signal output (HDOD) protein
MLRVLFVDDEPRVLQGLERALFPIPPDCSFAFAEGANRALEHLEKFEADAIVTDMRMPGMDGAALLTRVQQRWPAMLRVVLSGQVDSDGALRMMEVAHQFVSKPCDPHVLLGSLERLTRLQRILTSHSIRQLVGGIASLPSAPRIYTELTRKLADSQLGAASIASTIALDPAISAKVLQLANSVYFGRGRRIDSIRDAVGRLGVNNILQLVLCTELFGGVNGNAAVEMLQMRSLRASNLVQQMAGATVSGQIAQTAALLADVGWLLPDIETRCAAAVTTDGAITPAHAGAYLLGLWQIALPVVEAVAFQDDPAAISPESFEAVGLAHVAICLTHDRMPDLDYLRKAGVLEQLPTWQALAEATTDG